MPLLARRGEHGKPYPLGWHPNKVRVKVGVSMYKDKDDDLFQLFDTAEMDHVYDMVADCHDPAPKEHRSTLGDSLSKFLLSPLEKFICRLYESGRGSNASEFDACVSFRDCIENVMKILSLSNDEGGMPPEVSREIAQDLRAAWMEFIARSAAHRMYHDLPNALENARKRSIRNRFSAVIPRKNVAKADLEKYREDFCYQNGTYRGWLTAAAQHFGITMKTINKRIRE
jgi:hypothetical protein